MLMPMCIGNQVDTTRMFFRGIFSREKFYLSDSPKGMIIPFGKIVIKYF